MGRIYSFPLDDISNGGWVRIKVNNMVVATTGAYDIFDVHEDVSIDILQDLLVGDVVTVEFEGYNGGYLDSTSDYGAEKFVHWTGQKLNL